MAARPEPASPRSRSGRSTAPVLATGHSEAVAGKEPIRVYLAAQYDIVRSGLFSLLEAELDIAVVGQSGLASVALPQILELRPDVAVLDARLPDGSGLGLCRAIRAADPAIRGLILAGRRDDDAIATAMLAGAAGYMLEQINASSLVNGIRLVASGHSVVDWSVPASVVEHVALHKRSLQVVADLTPQQRKILFLIAEGLTNREIAARLYLAEKTVKNHVTALLSRLGVAHRTQAAMMAATWARAESATRTYDDAG
ncbi:DNA-binding response regulator [Nocardioides immobilis]|uniref:DNA-binding response regulator n=1 Tax=Nocardioides immobilis TaxID=2049295 RepID=A0A417XWD4_9ACTN|nr:DNA-binding response regulator [Nocardioides immobilis]